MFEDLQKTDCPDKNGVSRTSESPSAAEEIGSWGEKFIHTKDPPDLDL